MFENDESIYDRLIEPYRAELRAYCQRMLGSVDEAEDAVQEALLRAWNKLPSFEGRSSFRSWLYRIATNTSLDAIKRRRRLVPVDHAAVDDQPDQLQGALAPAGSADPSPEDPEASYQRRESVELAFTAALQLLPGSQRAVLILREVLGFSASETAAILETSAAAVNSALQRARARLERELPELSEESLRLPRAERLRERAAGYADAWERNDVDTLVSMLASDADFALAGREPAVLANAA